MMNDMMNDNNIYDAIIDVDIERVRDLLKENPNRCNNQRLVPIMYLLRMYEGRLLDEANTVVLLKELIPYSKLCLDDDTDTSIKSEFTEVLRLSPTLLLTVLPYCDLKKISYVEMTYIYRLFILRPYLDDKTIRGTCFLAQIFSKESYGTRSRRHIETLVKIDEHLKFMEWRKVNIPKVFQTIKFCMKRDDIAVPHSFYEEIGINLAIMWT